jgi:hypothetical protein
MRGKAYVFSRSAADWTFQAKLVTSQLGANLGASVGLSGDTAVLGHTCYGASVANVFFLQLQQGDPCTSPTLCPSGSCVDGVCCDRACDGQCEACDVAGNVGACTLVNGAPHGTRPACAGSGLCQGACDGANATACSFPVAGTECVHAQCTNGVATTAAFCDGVGACGASTTTNCGAYACGPIQCLTSCTSALECASGHVCLSGQCVPQLDAGVQTDAPQWDASEQRDAPSEQDATHPLDAAPHVDDAPAPDAGEGGIRARGCACRQAGTHGSLPTVLLGLTAALWRAARRRRR